MSIRKIKVMKNMLFNTVETNVTTFRELANVLYQKEIVETSDVTTLVGNFNFSIPTTDYRSVSLIIKSGDFELPEGDFALMISVRKVDSGTDLNEEFAALHERLDDIEHTVNSTEEKLYKLIEILEKDNNTESNDDEEEDSEEARLRALYRSQS